MSGIELASSQSIRAFKSSEEYLYAMKEDLAEWLNDLYGMDITVDNLVQVLQTGSLLCVHANKVTCAAAEFLHEHGSAHVQLQLRLPTSEVGFIWSAQPNTFQARDNVSNFINWCRTQMHIKDVLMFETDDLVLRKNEKNVVLCLLEVARRASRFGMAAPVLIQLEQEIDEEMRVENDQPVVQRCLMDSQNLDNMVQCLISRCTCPTQFPMVKITEGKYRVGDSSTNIFVRILRNHVMVRVGGGWDTLEHYLDKHDPCHCTSLIHKLAQRPATPVHEIKARQFGPDGQTVSQTSLLLSRVQSPVDPVVWSPSGPPRTSRSDPVLRNSCSPTKLRQPNSESKDDMVLKSTSRTSRDSNRASPSPRLTSSLPRPTRPSTPTRPETHRPSTPLVFHKVNNQACIKTQQGPDNKLGQTWTKSQFVSKLRQNATVVTKTNQESQRLQEKPAGQHRQRNNTQAKPFQCVTPVQSVNQSCSTQEPENNINVGKNQFIRTFCPSRGRMGVILGESNKKGQSDSSEQIQPTVQGLMRSLQRYSSPTKSHSKGTPPEPYSIVNAKRRDGDLGNRYLFTPPPISPAQEAMLYQSLEEEILSNLQQLEMDSDSGDSEQNEFSIRPETPYLLNSTENTSSVFSSTSRPTSRKDASFDGFIGALTKEKKPREKGSTERCRGRKQERQSQFDPRYGRSMANSWSSLGSSMESRESIEPPKMSGVYTAVQADSSDSGIKCKERPQGSSSSKRRSLKKPERVPSIYKLKLRPCVRPRRDHRPDKNPTRIPKPVFYRRSQSPKDTTHTITDSTAMSNTRKGLSIIRRSSTLRRSRKNLGRTTKCQGIVQERVTDQDVEYWV
ncbi:GAS2-like protein 2A [Trichomycterus rosablanca]|uniref:GAS2-like protein 2A n=1 Tax=Trichomycterus rosablanca TaxID=2290929 RepID=UPI002F34F4F0